MIKNSFILIFLIPFFIGTGDTVPNSGTNNAGIAGVAWTNPGNCIADDAADATCNSGLSSSQYLVATGYLFSLPTGSTIAGITVRVEASEHSTGTEELNARLQDASGALFGSTKSATISGTAKAVYTYGSASDLWTLLAGSTITEAIVEDVDFGVRFWFTTSHDVRVDYVTIALEYYTGGGFFKALSKSKTIKSIKSNYSL